MSFRRHELDSATAARFLTLKPGETITMIGKCPEKGCRHGKRVEVPGLLILTPGHRLYSYAHDPEQRFLDKGYEFPEGSRWYTGAAYATHDMRSDYRCPEHGYGLAFKELHAYTISTHACDEACLKATGAECKCACGGANHGMDA